MESGVIVWRCTLSKRGRPQSTRFTRLLGVRGVCPYCKSELLPGGMCEPAQGVLL